ncbi:MAG: alpha/beta fold hydrolase [Planctomycetia bacterium]|nr:alpha/beta fold hydrolase [Planctomycetia bacterium]
MRRIDVNGASLNVIDRGAGPAVVFIHGFPLNHTMWAAQLDALAANNRLIAPDLRGFGQSTATDGTVTIAQFADDVAAALDALAVRQPVCLCGLSMGGYVAFQFLRKYRDRVRSLVLCDTRSAADTPEAAEGRRKMAEEVLRNGTAALAEAMLPRLLHPRTAQERPQVAAAVRDMILSCDPRGVAAAQRGMAARPDVTELLPSIDVRTLVIVGQEDAISPPAEMRKIAAAIPQAQFVEVPDAGHMAPMENAALVNAALAKFLADELHAR